jgi:hypothetical protein
MAMKFLAFHNQLVADLAPDNQNDNFVSFDIIQGPQITCPQLELGQGIGTQPLDRFRGRRGLVLQPGQDGRLQDSLFASRQRPELPVGVFRDGDLERHSTVSASSTLLPAARGFRLTPRVDLGLQTCENGFRKLMFFLAPVRPGVDAKLSSSQSPC